jgi:hypothetical protein
LEDKELLARIIFLYPQRLIGQIGEVQIQLPPLDYSSTESSKREEEELVQAFTSRANRIFGTT